MKHALTIFILALLFSSCAQNPVKETQETVQSETAKTQKKFPEPQSHLNDFEDVFTAQEQRVLDSVILETQAHAAGGNKDFELQIALVTVPDTLIGDKEMLGLATAIGQEWGVGKMGTNNGLVIAFSRAARKVAIATGTGLEKHLTDEQCDAIINDIIKPDFRKQDYYGGIIKALAEIDNILSKVEFDK